MSASAQVARENGKKGGRPKGSKTKATLLKEEVMKAWRQRVMEQANNLLNYQLTLARGQTFLYKIEINPKTKSKSRPILVEDQEIIEAYLNNELNNEKDEYYYLTTKEPSNHAIDSMLDRAAGKATNVTEISGTDGGPISVTVIKYGDNPTV